MIRMIKMIFKIIHYLLVNIIVGLVMALFAYVFVGNVKFSILVFVMIFVFGLFGE